MFGLNYQNHHHKRQKERNFSTFEKSTEGRIVRIVYIKRVLIRVSNARVLNCTRLRAAQFRAIWA